MINITEVEQGIFQFDIFERGQLERTCCYLIRGDSWAIVDPGPTSSIPYVSQALEKLNIRREEIRYVVVTHIHLDHAGGVGTLLKDLIYSQVVVHQRGAKHLVNNEKFWRSAKAAWGKEIDKFGIMEPVPEKDVIPVSDGNIINLGGRLLEVLETPGHAKHHMAIHDFLTNGIFTGDAAGVFEKHFSLNLVEPWYRPATPIPDFDFKESISSLLKIIQREPQRLYLAHFGFVDSVRTMIESIIGQLVIWHTLAETTMKQQKTFQDFWILLEKYIIEKIKKDAKEKKIETNLEQIAEILKMSGLGVWQDLLKKE